MRTLMRQDNEAFIVMRSCLPSLYPKFFPYRTLLRGIRNMVDKLFFRGELFALRCSFTNLSILSLFLLGPYFMRGSTQRMGLTFLWPMDKDSPGPLAQARQALSSVFILFNTDSISCWYVFVLIISQILSLLLSVFKSNKKKQKKKILD